MTYQQQLHPWCIIRLLPSMQRVVITRCRRRNDAEAHRQILRQQVPTATYEIVFDLASNQARESGSEKEYQI